MLAEQQRQSINDNKQKPTRNSLREFLERRFSTTSISN
jgi:hypothetical protein